MGGILADLMLGHHPVCAIEIDNYCQQVLAARQKDGSLPWFPIFDDVRKFDGNPWRGIIDIIAGGFPCQVFSSAARGRNNAHDLWPAMLRVIKDTGRPIVFAENVAKRAIQQAADDLRAIGYKAAAVPVSALDMGADHVRQRYWLVAYANNEGELLCGQYAEMGMLPELHAGVWKSKPGSRRVSNGLACRMERHRAIGNGQVPICAAVAFIEGCRRLTK